MFRRNHFDPYKEDWKKLDRKSFEEHERERKKQMEDFAARIEEQKKQVEDIRRRMQLAAQKNVTSFVPPQEVKKELELKFQTETVIGYRVWRTTPFETGPGVAEQRLKSVGANYTWPGYQRMEAGCLRNAHYSPYPTCACGIWSLKNRDDMFTTAMQYGAWVVGEVHMWGRVLQCARGYRAQYSYPERLWTSNKSLVERLRAGYGVPVEFMELPILAPPPEAPSFGAWPQGHMIPPSSGASMRRQLFTTSTTTTSPLGWTNTPVTWGNATGGITGSNQ